METVNKTNMFGVPKGVEKNFSVTVNCTHKYGLMWNSTNLQGEKTHSHFFTNNLRSLNKFIEQSLTNNGYKLGSVW